MVGNNLISFHFFSIFFFSFFIFVILNSISNKALCFMLAHCLLLPCDVRNILDKTNHRIVAFACKFIIITCFYSCEFKYTVFLSFHEWVLWNIWVNIISEISYKPLTCFEFYVHGLIIYHGPLSFNNFIVTLFSVFTKYSFCLEAF